VRVLRALRQSLDLDFALTPETRTAVIQSAPLLPHSSTERVRDELLKLMGLPAPARAIEEMAALELLPHTLPEIAALANVAQSEPHTQPVLAHTLAVLTWLNGVETAVFGNEALGNEALGNEALGNEALAVVRQALAPYAPGLAAHLARGVDGGVNGRLLLRLGALFHDVGKQATQVLEENGRIRFLGHETVGAEQAARRLRQLVLSQQAVKHVETIVAGHMRPLLLLNAGGLPSRRAVYRYFRDLHTAGLDIGLLTLADHLGTYEGPGPADKWAHLVAIVARLFDHYFNHHADTVAPAPLLNGRDLITHLQLRPGPEIGRLLRLIQEAQAAGELHTREEALAFARQSRQ
jgi:poly(A) polymerase